MRILLIVGGWSNEREISLTGGKAIAAALREIGHHIDWLDPAVEFAQLAKKAAQADFAFLNLHGAPGEDGLIQAFLDRLGCPYQGSGPAGSLLALDKAAAKSLYVHAGLATPPWELLIPNHDPEWQPSLRFPLFIKPNQGGSSLGVQRVYSQQELQAQLSDPKYHFPAFLLEEAVQGNEVTCAIVGETALPPILIQPAQDAPFFDYHSKYTPEAAQEICPAPLSKAVTAAVQEAARRAHKTLGLQGYSRTDFILADGTPYALETNTLPGMTPNSLLPLAAAARGQSFAELVQELIDLGLARTPCHGPGAPPQQHDS
ncbi:MAG: D-alanine--D-alanine ligase family protein [Thermodesulfobacteriota bacterium]